MAGRRDVCVIRCEGGGDAEGARRDGAVAVENTSRVSKYADRPCF
jgi:hypothetical protein